MEVKILFVLALLISSTLFGGILNEDNYWAYVYTTKTGDHTYTENITVRTYKDGTYKLFQAGKEIEKGTLLKVAHELYRMTSSNGKVVILQTNGAFSITLRFTSSKMDFINLNPPESYKEIQDEKKDTNN